MHITKPQQVSIRERIDRSNKEVEHCAKGAKAVAPECSEKCIAAQLKEGHKHMGDSSKPVKYSPTGKNFIGRVGELMAKIKSMLTKVGTAGPGA